MQQPKGVSMSLFSGILDSITPGVGSAIGGALSLFGGLSANKASAEQAQINRDFQAGQSATSYQRAVADMQAAGLNPMLAYSQGGASTPSGSVAQQSDVVTPAVSSAKDVGLARQNLNNMQATEDLTKNQTKATVQQAQKTYMDTIRTLELLPWEKQVMNSQIQQNTANARVANINADLGATELPGKKNNQAIDETWFGKYVRPVLKDVVSGLTSAKAGADIFRGKPPVTVINKGGR